MRFVAFLVLTCLILAACADPAGVDEHPGATSSTSEAASALPTGSNEVDLPGGVQLTSQTQLRSDKTTTSKAGATRRRVVYEFLAQEPKVTMELVAADLARAGYTAVRRKETKGGNIAVTYRKKNAKTINVLYFSRAPKKPANPEAKSVVAMSWQIKKAPKRE